MPSHTCVHPSAQHWNPCHTGVELTDREFFSCARSSHLACFREIPLRWTRFRASQVDISPGCSETALGNSRKNTCLEVSYPRRIRFRSEMWSHGMQLPKKLCFNIFVFRVAPTNQLGAYLRKATEFIILEIWNRICNVISVAGSLLLVKILSDY